MGTASTTRADESTEWATAVSTSPSVRQTSHAGKKEPRISKDGARLQLVQSVSASGNPNVDGRRSAFVIMVESFLGYFEWYRRFGKQDRPAPPALESAPVCRSTAPAPRPSVHW